eukprot:scaffold1694_cov126-Isochrysis_galbana.AAC.3
MRARVQLQYLLYHITSRHDFSHPSRTTHAVCYTYLRPRVSAQRALRAGSSKFSPPLLHTDTAALLLCLDGAFSLSPAHCRGGRLRGRGKKPNSSTNSGVDSPLSTHPIVRTEGVRGVRGVRAHRGLASRLLAARPAQQAKCTGQAGLFNRSDCRCPKPCPEWHGLGARHVQLITTNDPARRALPHHDPDLSRIPIH